MRSFAVKRRLAVCFRSTNCSARGISLGLQGRGGEGRGGEGGEGRGGGGGGEGRGGEGGGERMGGFRVWALQGPE